MLTRVLPPPLRPPLRRARYQARRRALRARRVVRRWWVRTSSRIERQHRDYLAEDHRVLREQFD